MLIKIRIFALLLVAVFVAVNANGQSGETWTNKSVEIKASATSENNGVLSNVRVGKHKEYDRVVFEFSGEFVPGCKIDFAKPPFYLGESDETVKLTGTSFLQIAFTPAYAHDLESGQATIKNPDKLPRFPTLKEAKLTYDHEGQVIYILGLVAQKSFRAQALSNPARLVLDIKH